MKKFAVVAICIVAVVSIVGNVLLFLRYSSTRPLIDVNNKPIRRSDLDFRLDYLYSNNILRQLILADLVDEAATKAGVMPTQQDVKTEEAEIERSDPQIIAAAKRTDPTLLLFDEDLRTKLALRNLRVVGISVSDADAQAFYQHHKSEFQLPQQTKSMVVIAQDSIGAQTAQRLLQNSVSSEVIAGQPGLKVIGVNAPPINNLPQPIAGAVLLMKPGMVRTFPVGSNYVIIKVNSVSPGGVPPLTTIMPQVKLAAALAKAPTDNDVLTKLVEAASIKVESDKYAAAVPHVGTQTASAQ